MQSVSYRPGKCQEYLCDAIYRVIFAATPARVDQYVTFRTFQTSFAEDSCTFVQAVCAAMASPTLFEPYSFGSGLLDPTYIGTPLTLNNPARIVIREAQGIYGAKRMVSLILSLGSGLGSVYSLDEEEGLSKKFENLTSRIVKDTEGVAEDLSEQYLKTTAYLRLNVDRGMENIQMADWNKLRSIAGHTRAYLNKGFVKHNITESAKFLHERRLGSVNIGSFSTYKR
jgi:hypothetical protein